MAETVGFRIKIEGADDLTKTELALEKINQEIRQAKKEQNTSVYGRLRREQLVLQEDAKRLRKDIRTQIKDFQDVKKNIPTDSIIGLRKQYRDLTKQINEMSAAQRNSKFGANVAREAKQIKAELDKVEQSMGSYRGNVGNYKTALTGVGRQALGAFGLTSGVYAGVAILKDATKITTDYEQSNANLAAILGKTTEETIKLREQQKQLGATTAFTATQVSELQTELSKLGFAEQEILDSTAAIIDFAVATKAEVPRAAALAGAALRAFSLDAKEMERVVEVMGVATTKSALDFAKLETQLPIVAGVANEFGDSIEITTAKLGVLADRGIDASTAATSLRNMYLELAGAGMTWAEGMDVIKNSQDKATASLDLFGKRGAVAGLILAQNEDSVNGLTEALEGANGELAKMAEKQLDTTTGKLTLLRSAWEGFILSVEDGDGAISNLAGTLIDAANDFVTSARLLNEGVSFMDYVGLANPFTRSATIDKLTDRAEIEKAGTFVDDAARSAENWYKNTEKTNEELDELNDKIEKLDKTSKKNKDILPKGSLAEMEQSLSEINKQLARATEDSEIKKLVNEAAELSEKINNARIQLEGLKDAAGGGVLASGLESSIDAETSNILGGDDFDGAAKVDKELFDQRISDAEFLAELESNIEQELHDEQMAMLQEYEDAAMEIDKEIFNNQRALNEAIQQEKLRVGLETAQNIASSIFQIEYNNAQRQLNAESDRLDEQYEKRIEAAEGNADLQKKLEEELAGKQEELAKKAFEDNKDRQIAEALINGALAITQSLANTVLPFPASLIAPAAITAQTAAQIAIISSQSYADGGFTGYGGIMDPNLPNRRISGYVHDNEYVAPTSQIHKYPQLFKFLETDRLRGFDQGGFTTPPLDYNAMLDGLAASSSLGSGVSAVDLADIISRAVYEGSKRGSQEGTLVGSKEGTKVGSFEGTKDGTKEATKESELEKIRVQRSNKNIKQ